MIKLLGDDIGVVRVDLHFPLAEKLGLCKTFNEFSNAVEPVYGLCDHLAAEVPHFIRILREVIWERCLVAPRRNQIDVFSSLC